MYKHNGLVLHNYYLYWPGSTNDQTRGVYLLILRTRNSFKNSVCADCYMQRGSLASGYTTKPYERGGNTGSWLAASTKGFSEGKPPSYLSITPLRVMFLHAKHKNQCVNVGWFTGELESSRPVKQNSSCNKDPNENRDQGMFCWQASSRVPHAVQSLEHCYAHTYPRTTTQIAVSSSQVQSNSQGGEVPFKGRQEVEVSQALELTGGHCDGVVIQVQHQKTHSTFRISWSTVGEWHGRGRQSNNDNRKRLLCYYLNVCTYVLTKWEYACT